MKGRIKSFLSKLLLCLAVVSYSCSDEAYVAVEYSPVNYNINEMPYENLSQYNFFQGELKNLDPVYGVSGYNHAMMIQTNTTRYPTTRWLKICNSSKWKNARQT